MKTVRTALVSTGVPEYRGPSAVGKEPKVMSSAPAPATAPQSHTKAVSRGGRVWSKPTIRELEAPMGIKDEEALVLKVLQWETIEAYQ